MSRITRKHLEAQCNSLNRLEGAALTAYSKDEATGKYTANIGHYCIDSDITGYSLQRITNAGGGVSNPLSIGYVSARELSGLISSYLAGMNRAKWRIEDAQQANKAGE
jgi:hypothetical protein